MGRTRQKSKLAKSRNICDRHQTSECKKLGHREGVAPRPVVRFVGTSIRNHSPARLGHSTRMRSNQKRSGRSTDLVYFGRAAESLSSSRTQTNSLTTKPQVLVRTFSASVALQWSKAQSLAACSYFPVKRSDPTSTARCPASRRRDCLRYSRFYLIVRVAASLEHDAQNRSMSIERPPAFWVPRDELKTNSPNQTEAENENWHQSRLSQWLR